MLRLVRLRYLIDNSQSCQISIADPGAAVKLRLSFHGMRALTSCGAAALLVISTIALGSITATSSAGAVSSAGVLQAEAGQFVPIAPTKILDTRDGTGIGGSSMPNLAAGASLDNIPSRELVRSLTREFRPYSLT